MHRFFAPCENFSGDHVELSVSETRHLRDVLRLTPGHEVSVFDGDGAEFQASITGIGKKSSVLHLIAKTEPTAPESPLAITLGATVLSGEKYDLVVQKAVELGVATLQPLNTIRCDVKIKDAVKRMERWRRIALEATKQSGRARLMRINEPVGFVDLMGTAHDNAFVLFSERDGADFSTVTAGKEITALIGPKGGWDDSELGIACSMGVNIVTLGGRILRAETAAISLTTILQHRFGDLN